MDRAATSSADGAAVFHPGAWIGRYTILAKIGEGGMGAVFSAYDTELERRVAIKVLRPRANGDPLGHARMQREAQALARLSHPNVVQIHDVGWLGGQLFVAMEFVTGPTLRAWQREHNPRTAAGREAILAMYAQAGAGLAAAHARGLVHRDFKPDNVLVGDDGRARVLDFGLAAGMRVAVARDGSEEQGSGEGGGAGVGVTGLLDSDLTRTGSIMGTPAYMAPEQFLAQRTDARADVFAFAVALYEALYAELPFAGETFAERQAEVIDGAVRPAPAGAAIPAWLRGVLLRGIERDPERRYPDIDALLAGLADDPIARRRRRLRVAGALVLTAAVIVGLVIGGLSLAQRWRAARAEAMAEERRLAVEARIDELLAAGATAEAERAFQAYVTNPDNRGSAALARAWLGHGERARSREVTDEALDAYASAYTVATASAEQIAALIGLAQLARDQLRWRGLVFAAEALEERFPEHLDRPEIRELRLDAALARLDLDAAQSILAAAGPAGDDIRSVIAALRGAQHTPYSRCTNSVRALRGRGEDVQLLLGCSDYRPESGGDEDTSGDRSTLVRVDRELSRVGVIDSFIGPIQALGVGPDGRGLMIRGSDPSAQAEGREATLYALDGATPSPLFRWPEDTITAALAADIDGDGEDDYLVGSGPYTRHIRQLVEEPGEGWSLRTPAPSIDRRRSDVVDLLAGDLDGDGVTEVVAALGPWIAYELQVLRHDPARQQLRPLTRHRLGSIAGAALVRPGGGAPPEVVVIKNDEYPNAGLFPPDKPLGEPAGVYFFSLRDGALVETSRVLAPRSGDSVDFLDTRPLVGDLDGDGDDEVIFSRRRMRTDGGLAQPILVVLVRGDDGRWTPLHLSEVWPVAVADVDGDGADELLVAPEDTRDLWVLGAGDERLPTPPLRLSERLVSGAPEDPALARMWRHAGDLAQMGLTRQAAESFATIADLSLTAEERARAQVIAGEQFEMIADDAAAAPLYAQAAAAGHAPAGVAAARSYVRLGDVERAAAELDRLRDADAGAVDADDVVPLTAAVADLRREAGLDVRFDRPLDSIWRIDQPLALLRGAARLGVDAIVMGDIMSTPLTWEGSTLSLELELDLTRIEWMGGLDLAVVPANGGPIPIRIDIGHGGGGSQRQDVLGAACYGRRVTWTRAFNVDDRDPARRRRIRVRVTLLSQMKEWIFEVTDEAGEVLARHRLDTTGESPAGSAYRLVLSGTRDSKTWVAASLSRLTLTGVAQPRLTPERLAEVDAPAQRAGRRLVERDPLGALEALEELDSPSASERLLGVVARARLGRWHAAEAELRDLFADDASVAAITPELRALLRVEPAVYGPLLRGAAGSSALHDLLTDAWSLAFEMEINHPDTLSALWGGLIDYDLERGMFTPLKMRGIVARRLGHRQAAEASLRAALEALRDPERAGDLTYESREYEDAAIRFEQAACAVEARDIDRAEAFIRPLLDVEDPDPYVVDRLRARADLRPLWGLAEGL